MTNNAKSNPTPRPKVSPYSKTQGSGLAPHTGRTTSTFKADHAIRVCDSAPRKK